MNFCWISENTHLAFHSLWNMFLMGNGENLDFTGQNWIKHRKFYYSAADVAIFSSRFVHVYYKILTWVPRFYFSYFMAALYSSFLILISPPFFFNKEKPSPIRKEFFITTFSIRIFMFWNNEEHKKYLLFVIKNHLYLS